MRYTQPQSGPAPVDTSHPLAKGLVLAVNPGTSPFRDMAGRTAVRNGISVAPGPRGIGYVAAGNASLGAQFATSPMITSNGTYNGDFTYLVIANPIASTTREFFVCNQSGVEEFYFGANFDPALTAISGIITASTNVGGGSGVIASGAADGNPHIYAYTRAGATGSMYVDGALGGTAAVLQAQIGRSTSSDYIGGYSGTGWGISKSVFLVLGWNRALSAAEVKSISANPWQLFRSPQRVMLAAAGASAAALSGVSISPASSSGVLTTAVKLAGTSQSSSVSSGGINTAVPLTGTSRASSISGGALLTGIALTGSNGTPVFSSGALTTTIKLAGTSSTSSASIGALLSPAIALTGSSSTPVFSSGILATAIKLAGTSASPTSSSGVLMSNAAALTGTSSTAVSSNAALATGIRLAGMSRTASVSSGGIITTVPTAPDAPTIGIAVVLSETSVLVNGTPPVNNGGSDILGYTATSIPPNAGDSSPTFSSTLPVTVYGLPPGQPLQFTLNALSIYGYSAESAASNIVTIPLPVIPVAQSVVFSGGTNRVIFDGGTTRAVFDASTTHVIFGGGINNTTF